MNQSVAVLKEMLCFAFSVCCLEVTYLDRNETGMTDLKHIGDKVKRYEDSVKHLKNMIDLAMLWPLNKTYRQQ